MTATLWCRRRRRGGSWGPLIALTRRNVQLHIDDGGTREPSFDFESLSGLRGWTVRLQDWLDAVVPWIRPASRVETEFPATYDAFQRAYLGNSTRGGGSLRSIT
jgi:hypothetical protein